MSYIGQRPVVGRYIKLDQISSGFNGSNTGFSMTAGSQAVFPGTARNLLLSLGGVIQEPDTDFTISGSTLTFTTPPVANTTFFGVIYGDMQATGTPSDGTVLPASIASSGNFSFPQLTVTSSASLLGGAVFNENGADVDFRVEGDTDANLLFVDASTDRVGIGTNTPDTLLHLAGEDTAVIRLENTDTSLNTNQLIGGLEVEKQDPSGAGVGVVGGLRMYSGVNGITTYLTLSTSNSTTNNEEQVRITSDGHLLVNTTSEGGGSYDQLTVAGGIKITDDSNSKLEIGRYSSSSAHSYIKIGSNSGSLRITNAADSSDLVTLTNSGSVGIGITSPNADLDITTSVEDSTGTLSAHGIRLSHVGATDEEVIPITAGFLTQVDRARAGIGFISKQASSTDGYAGAIGFYTRNTADGNGLLRSDERMRIDPSGDIGIGTDNPGARLHVHSSTSNTCATFESSDAGAVINLTDSHTRSSIEQNNTDLKIQADTSGTHANSTMKFQVDGSTRMLIDSSGRLLQGKTATKGSTGEVVPTFCTETASNSSPNVFEIANNGTNANNSYSALVLSRSDSTSVNGHTAVDSDDQIGEVCFIGADGSDRFNTAAAIKAFADSDFTANDCPANLTFHTNGGSAAASERMRISASGNVSIGTTTDHMHKLEILNGTDQDNIIVARGADESTEYAGIGVTGGNAVFTAGGVGSTSAGMVFRTASGGVETERARIDSAGRLVVGATSAFNNFGFTTSAAIQAVGAYNVGSIASVNNEANGNTCAYTSAKIRGTNAVNNGDIVGSHAFDGYDGGTFRTIARIDCAVSSAVSSNSISGELRFRTRDGSTQAERMRINSTGVVQIVSERMAMGTSVTNGGTSDGNFCIEFTGNTRNAMKTRDTDNTGTVNHFVLVSGSAACGTITTSTGQAFFNNLSDYRSKENDVKITDGIEKIKLLRPIRFNYKVDKDTLCDGFFAHEVTAAVPTAVNGEKDAVDSEGEIDPQMLDTGKIIPLLTAALQEAITKIETLETKVAALEAA